MGLFENFPYTNFHELNLDWLLKNMLDLKSQLDNYGQVVENFLPSFHGNWNESTNYPALSVVLNGGVYYQAKKDVPAGVATSNSEYWLEINLPYWDNVDTLVNSIPWKSVKEYGAVGDGVTNDTAAFTACLAENDICYVPQGTYIVTELEIDSNKTLLGANCETCVLKAVNGEYTNIVKTKNFDNMVGKDTTGGCKNFRISNIGFDGVDRKGRALGIVGYRFKIDNILIKNCNEGLSSQWGTSVGAGEDGDFMESIITNFRIHHCNTGIVWRGPHDSIFTNGFVYLCTNGIQCLNREYSIANGTIFNTVHVYGCSSVGFYSTSTIIHSNCISESNNHGFNADEYGSNYYIGCSVFANTGTDVVFNSPNNYYTGMASKSSSGAIFEFGDTGTNCYINIIAPGTSGLYTGSPQTKGNTIISYGKKIVHMCANVDITKEIPAVSTAVNNDTLSQVAVYMKGKPENCVVQIVEDVTWTRIDVSDCNPVILKPRQGIIFTNSVPTSWHWEAIN